jgi:multiple sugar transport system permease protein
MTSVKVPLRYRVPWKKLVIYMVAAVFGLILVAPFYWIFIMSLKHEVDAHAVPPQWLPADPTLDNYLEFVEPSGEAALAGNRAVQDTPYALANSLLVATLTSVLNLVLAIFAAYSFSRIRFRGSQALLLLYLLTRMVPGIAIIIPFYLLMRTLGLLDTYLALILSYTTFALPVTIWILKDFFRTVPRELEDAARVDRCGWFRMMWSVFLPISAPGLVAAAVFSFMTAWNEFMFALFLTSSRASQTIPVIAANFATDLDVQYGLMAASGVLAVLPPLVLVLIFQRLIVQGMAAGSVKG